VKALTGHGTIDMGRVSTSSFNRATYFGVRGHSVFTPVAMERGFVGTCAFFSHLTTQWGIYNLKLSIFLFEYSVLFFVQKLFSFYR